MRPDEARDLKRLLVGELFVDDSGCCTPQRALVRLASAQVRAVRAAMSTMGASFDLHDDDRRQDGRLGWQSDDEFTMDDAMAALGGIQSLLHHGPELLTLVEEVLAQDEPKAEAAE